jgi:hypothetical protein
MNARIAELFALLRAEPFPPEARCQEVAGVDLIATDYTTAGCVQTFVARGYLDPWRLSVLGLCLGNLTSIVAATTGAVRVYFERLLVLSRLVLENIRDESSPD